MPGSRIHPKGQGTSTDARYDGGTFVNITVSILSVLPYIVLLNNDTVPWTVTFTTKSGGSIVYKIFPGDIQSWPTATFNQISAPLPTKGTAANFEWFYSPVQFNAVGAIQTSADATPAVVTATLTFTAGSTTQQFITSIPVGKRWRIWGIAFNLQGGSGITVTGITVNLWNNNTNTNQYGIGELSGVLNWVLDGVKQAAILWLPTGVTSSIGTAAFSQTFLFPPTLLVGPDTQIVIQITGTVAAGMVQLTAFMQALGIEELL